jgi:hypothetical protein
MLLISYYEIISYMNVFFTCKNTLVIILQFYRLFVVQIEKKKELAKAKQAGAGVCGNLVKAVGRNAFLGHSTQSAASTKRTSRAAPKSKSGQDLSFCFVLCFSNF